MNETQELIPHRYSSATALPLLAQSERCRLNHPTRRRRTSVLLTAVAGLTLTFFLPGCGPFIGGPTITGSGNVVTKPYPFTNFTGISAGASFDVQVTQGASPTVSVTADDNLVEYLDVTASGNRLNLFLKSNVNVRNATLRAVVSIPELTALDLSGASRGKIQGCRTAKEVDIELSGASRLEGDLESGDTRLELSGASHAVLKGSAGNVRVNASGASHADLEQFKVKDASVDVDGASHLIVSPSGKLSARASGASSVRYAGQPTSVDSSASGASSIKPK